MGAITPFAVGNSKRFQAFIGEDDIQDDAGGLKYGRPRLTWSGEHHY